MERAKRVFLIVIVSVLYWIAAAGCVVLAAFVVPGDCGTEPTSAGLSECLSDVRIVMLVGLAVAALLYAWLLRRFARTL